MLQFFAYKLNLVYYSYTVPYNTVHTQLIVPYYPTIYTQHPYEYRIQHRIIRHNCFNHCYFHYI
jgi:hypothetical protein